MSKVEEISSKSIITNEKNNKYQDKTSNLNTKQSPKSVLDYKKYTAKFYTSDYYSSIMMNDNSSRRQPYKNKVDPITYREIYGYEKYRYHFIKKQMQYNKEHKIIESDNRPSFDLNINKKMDSTDKLKYNPLMDKHLRAYFLDGNVRSQLIKQKLITKHGEILEDKGLEQLKAKNGRMPRMESVKRLKNFRILNSNQGSPSPNALQTVKSLNVVKSLDVIKSLRINKKAEPVPINPGRIDRARHLSFLENIKKKYNLAE